MLSCTGGTPDAHAWRVFPRKALWVALAMCACTVVAAPASAEWFADVYIGGAFTSGADIDRTDSSDPPGVVDVLKDVEFDSSFAVGGRAGYWFERVPWYGVGLDLFNYRADIGTQGVNINGVPDVLDSLDLSVLAIGFDVVRLRAQLMKHSTRFPKGQLQPYFTLGPVLAITWVEDSVNFDPNGQEDSDAAVGVKLGVGATWLFTKQMGLFGEYRFNHVSSSKVAFTDVPDQKTLDIDLNTHYLLVGISAAF